MDQPSTNNNFQNAHSLLLKTNFENLFKEAFPIDVRGNSIGQAIYESRFIVLSHNNESVPVFTYANLSAQKLWELSWDELTHMPSKNSARKDSQQDRAELLATVQRDGCSKSYSGIRMSSSGRRFQINNVYVWNLYDDGRYVGQAALFDEWAYLD